MEKYVHRTRLKRKTGFLKAGFPQNSRPFRQPFVLAAALICLFSFSAHRLSAAEHALPHNELRFELFEPNEKPPFLQTNTDCTFAANIPDAQPAQVEVFFENPPSGAVFRGFEKKAEEGGTRLTYSVRFIKAGKTELPPARVRIRDKTYALAFPSLNVFDNPDFLVPEFFFTADTSPENSPSEQTAQPSQTVQAGTSVRVQLMGRYFRHIQDINRQNPEDALLEESARFFEPAAERTFAANGEHSPEAVPVAEFVYTPFFEGIREFPHTEVKAESYNGTFYTVKVSPLILNVVPAPETEASAVQEPPHRPNCYTLSIYADNLAKAAPVQDPTVETADTDESPARSLAELRSKERLSPAFWVFRRERKALEKKLLLQNPDEASLFWTLAAAVLLCILPAPAFVLFKKKRAKKIAVSICLLGCFCVVILIKNIPPLMRPGLIAHNAVLRAIPEIGAQGSAVLQEGTRLRLLHKSGDWYLTAAAERSGWILKSEAIEIQNKTENK